ncbi:hypothetical protein Hanom_Chr09g00815331 [Helianthus anomalus]
MAPEKDNLSESVSILTQRQLDKFVRDYRIPLDPNPVLHSKDEPVYPFRQGKFPLYTRVVLRFFRVHLCQVNPFGLSRVNQFEISCRALNQKPDMDVFRYFYEFITASDWYTFGHWKGIPSPSGDERSSLKIGRTVSTLAQEIRPLTEQSSSKPPPVDAVSTIPKPTKEAVGSSGSRAKGDPQPEDVDGDPEVWNLDEALMYRPSGVSIKSKGISSDAELKGLLRKRKANASQIRSSNPLLMPKAIKKTKKSTSFSSDNVLTDLDEHLSGENHLGKKLPWLALLQHPPSPLGDGEALGEAKVVTFLGTILDSSLGLDCFLDDEED